MQLSMSQVMRMHLDALCLTRYWSIAAFLFLAVVLAAMCFRQYPTAFTLIQFQEECIHPGSQQPIYLQCAATFTSTVITNAVFSQPREQTKVSMGTIIMSVVVLMSFVASMSLKLAQSVVVVWTESSILCGIALLNSSGVNLKLVQVGFGVFVLKSMQPTKWTALHAHQDHALVLNPDFDNVKQWWHSYNDMLSKLGEKAAGLPQAPHWTGAVYWHIVLFIGVHATALFAGPFLVFITLYCWTLLLVVPTAFLLALGSSWFVVIVQELLRPNTQYSGIADFTEVEDQKLQETMIKKQVPWDYMLLQIFHIQQLYDLELRSFRITGSTFSTWVDLFLHTYMIGFLQSYFVMVPIRLYLSLEGQESFANAYWAAISTEFSSRTLHRYLQHNVAAMTEFTKGWWEFQACTQALTDVANGWL